jgi:OOP family OmpA-OmpF porin
MTTEPLLPPPVPPPQPPESVAPPPQIAAHGLIATQSLPEPPARMDVAPQAPTIVPPVDSNAVARQSACQERLTRLGRIGPILFRVGSAELDSISAGVLDGLASAAKSCPELHIEIAGHASAEGGGGRNQLLSTKRARSVLSYLVKAGVEAVRLEAVGYGATRPIAPNDSQRNMARNRRIEFVVRRP